MNNFVAIGYLGKDVELRYSQNGTPFASFSLAVDDSYTNRDGQKVEKTMWIDVNCSGSLAEVVSNHLHKGSRVAVEGKIDLQEWQDRETGQKRSKHVVRANRVEFLSPRNENNNAGNASGGDNYGGQNNAPQNRQNPPHQPQSNNQSAPPQNNYQGNNNQNGQWSRNGNQGGGNQNRYNNNQGYGNYDAENLGPAFPSEASGMDDVPF